jgi:hypothetical protein
MLRRELISDVEDIEDYLVFVIIEILENENEMY